jgi:predicted DNA-binding protein (UPF0251 family)
VDRNIHQLAERCNGFRAFGQQSISATGEKQEEAKAIILSDRRVTTEEIALQLGVSQITVFSLVSDVLGFRKVSASLLPKHLTEEHNATASTSAPVFWNGKTVKVVTS